MTTYERRKALLGKLRVQPGISVSELATFLDVSEGTVRNDLNALEVQGLLTRVHGGAVLNQQVEFQENSFLRRIQENVDAKQDIALAVAAIVSNDSSLFLDASSTSYFLAQALSKHQRLRVMTNGFESARILAQNPSNTVFLLGGIVENDSSSVTGLLSERIIEELHIQHAFLSCSGFSLERGMTEVHLAEAQLKRKVIESSKELFALIDSSKFGVEDLTSFARLDRIRHLFTDQDVPSEWLNKLNQSGIEFTICKQSS